MDDLDDVSLPARLGNGMLKVIKMSLVIFNSTKRNDIYVTRAEVISVTLLNLQVLKLM